MNNDELIELQRVIRSGGPEAEGAASRFCDVVKDTMKRILSSISYKYSQEYLEWGVNEAFLAFRDNWDPEKGKYFKVYLWRYVKERVRIAIARDKGKESSIDIPLGGDGDEGSGTIGDLVEDKDISSEDKCHASELSAIMINVFNKMDSRIQLIMVEYFSNRFTYREIGLKLNIDHTTVMRNLTEEGIKPLRSEIEGYFKDQDLEYDSEVVLKSLGNFLIKRNIDNENRT